MSDNISPEEKLLRLIRGRKDQEAVTNKISPVIAPAALADLKADFKPSAFLSVQKYLSFLSIKKIIWIIFAVSCIYMISSFIYPWLGSGEIKPPEVTQNKVAVPEDELKRQEKPYEFYLEGIKNRQIFTSTSHQETQNPVSEAKANAADLIKDINLVGIISGENPQAVIEDKKTQKTYYVTKGQFIGEFEVKDIQEGKVILNYKDQKYELYI